MIELYLLETSAGSPDPQVLEELGWKLVLVWPPETCGNSIHRAVTLLLHLLDPQAKVFVGNRHYEEPLRDVFAPASNRT